MKRQRSTTTSKVGLGPRSTRSSLGPLSLLDAYTALKQVLRTHALRTVRFACVYCTGARFNRHGKWTVTPKCRKQSLDKARFCWVLRMQWACETQVAGGNSLCNVIVDTDETAARLVKLLEQRRLGRITFMPLNKLGGRKEHRYESAEVLNVIDVSAYSATLRRLEGALRFRRHAMM